MKILSKYFRKRKEAINLLLKKPDRAYTPTTFHALRLEIKRVDALFEMIHYCVKDFKQAETFKPFKEIFDRAGKVRELYIEETTIKKHSTIPLLKKYRARLKESRLKAEKEFFSNINKKTIDRLKKAYKEVDAVLEKIDKKVVIRYMKERWKKIKTIFNQKSLKASHAHDLRIELKQFEYNKKSLKLDKKFKSFPGEDKLPDLLGNWHDGEVIIRHLNKALKKEEITSTEIQESEKIKSKISAKTEKLFGKINDAIAAS